MGQGEARTQSQFFWMENKKKKIQNIQIIVKTPSSPGIAVCVQEV